jgi:surfactin synthase thioesterase subunit
MMKSQWITPLTQRARPRVNLVCFAFAGGAAGAFRELARKASDHAEVMAVQLPGREGRYGEPFARRIADIAPAIRRELLLMPVRPTIFFGYSMGALIAFEVARQMPGAFPLRHLVVGAKEAPHIAGERPKLHSLSDDALIEKVRELGGTPADVLNSRELMEFFLPRLRADFEVNETYAYDGEKVRCPILSLGGREDKLALPEKVARWGDLTTGPSAARLFDGKHFFFFERADAQAELLDIVGREAAPAPAERQEPLQLKWA